MSDATPLSIQVPPITPLEDTKRRARLTIVKQLYHNVPGEDTNGPSPLRFFRWLASDEIAYARTIKVGEEWIPLDLGWLAGKGCSYLSLENVSVRPLGKRASPEEEAEWAAKVIEWGIVIGAGQVMVAAVGYLLPEEGTGFSPTGVEQLRVRCRKGTGRLAYFVVPV